MAENSAALTLLSDLALTDAAARQNHNGSTMSNRKHSFPASCSSSSSSSAAPVTEAATSATASTTPAIAHILPSQKTSPDLLPTPTTPSFSSSPAAPAASSSHRQHYYSFAAAPAPPPPPIAYPVYSAPPPPSHISFPAHHHHYHHPSSMTLPPILPASYTSSHTAAPHLYHQNAYDQVPYYQGLGGGGGGGEPYRAAPVLPQSVQFPAYPLTTNYLTPPLSSHISPPGNYMTVAGHHHPANHLQTAAACSCPTHAPREPQWHGVRFLPKTTAHCPPNPGLQKSWGPLQEDIPAYRAHPPAIGGYFGVATAPGPPIPLPPPAPPPPPRPPPPPHHLAWQQGAQLAPFHYPSPPVSHSYSHSAYALSASSPYLSVPPAGSAVPAYGSALSETSKARETTIPTGDELIPSESRPARVVRRESFTSSASGLASNGVARASTSSSDGHATATAAGSAAAPAARRYTCPRCAKRFTRPSSLRTHLNSHTGEKPHGCHCGRRFSVLSNLRRHQRSATCTGGGGGSGGGAGSKGPPAGGARVLRKLDEVADEDEESSEEEREDEERCDVDGAGSEESKAESAAMSTSVRRDLTVDFDN